MPNNCGIFILISICLNNILVISFMLKKKPAEKGNCCWQIPDLHTQTASEQTLDVKSGKKKKKKCLKCTLNEILAYFEI